MMKYLWLNQNGKNDTSNMQSTSDIIKIRMLDNPNSSKKVKRKRFRSAFTTDQVNYLEKQFKKFPYISNAQRKDAAHILNIPERAIKIWFQNRRMKGKKEPTTKECDGEYGGSKSLEFGKDQLNNASVLSANVPPRSLPLLTETIPTNYNKNIITNNATCNMVTRQMQHSRAHITANASQNITAKVIHPPLFVKSSHHLSSEDKTSAEFSIDLCKKYKAGFSSTSPHVETFKKEVKDTERKVEYQPMGLPNQMKPEDLSPRRKSIFSIPVQQQPSTSAPNNSGYVSLVPTVSSFYAQPYISSSGVIWKPVNVMPVVSSNSTSVSAPGNQFLNMSTSQENFTNRCCNCDCHVRPQVAYNVHQQSPSSQYIITAVPFLNTSTKNEHGV